MSKPASLVTPWVITAEGALPLNELSVANPIQMDSARVILPRQYLFYIYIALANVPKSLRANVIQQRIQQVSPFSSPASWIIQEDNAAQVWFWDAALIAQHRTANPNLPQAILPESLLRAPQQEGFYLQACLNGWDMQYWVEGELRYTRWLSIKPDTRILADFVRQCGQNTANINWIELDAGLMDRPWNEKPFWTKETLTNEKIATKLIAGVLVAWVFLELGLGLGTQIKSYWLAAQVAEKNEAMMDLVNQRDGALRQQEFNQAIGQLVSAPSPLFLSAQIHQCLADFDFAILDWQYQRGQLVLLLQKEGLDTRALIESCAANPVFIDVRVEPGLTPEQTRVLFSLQSESSGEQTNAE